MTPTESESSAARLLATRHGERRAAALLDVTVTTLARTVAGFRLRQATHQRIAARLAELSAPERDRGPQ